MAGGLLFRELLLEGVDVAEMDCQQASPQPGRRAMSGEPKLNNTIFTAAKRVKKKHSTNLRRTSPPPAQKIAEKTCPC